MKISMHHTSHIHQLSVLLMVVFALAAYTTQAQNTIDKQGRKQGHWIKTDKDGSKIYEGTFVNGRESGTFVYYYPNGKIRIKNTYTVMGKRCNHEVYDSAGHLMATGVYDQRNRDSVWHFYNAEGKNIKIVGYKMGILDGEQVIFASNGDTAEVTHWKNNHRHGRWWKRIGKDGYITGTYEDGGLEGVLHEYSRNELIREGHYLNGSKHGSYKYFENKRLAVDEDWDHGMMTDRRVLVMQPTPAYVSIHKILAMVPQGKNKVIVYTKNGEAVTTEEPAEQLYARTGSEYFTLTNVKQRIMVATESVMGLKKDSEGRDILDLEPEISLDLYPDDDCLKMIQSLQREDFDK